MTIRAAAAADAHAIAEVHVSSWRTSYRGIVPDARLEELDVESGAQQWLQRFETMPPSQCCFVSLDDEGAVTGFVAAGPARSDDLGTDAEIFAIYLIEAAKGKGLGRGLMHRAAEHLKQSGFRSVCLWFLKENKARGLYERLGGRMEGEKPWVTGAYTLASAGCKWDSIETLLAATAGSFFYDPPPRRDCS